MNNEDKTYLHIGKNNSFGDIGEAIMKALVNSNFPLTALSVIRLVLDNPQTQDKMGITKQQKFCEESCEKAKKSHEAYIKTLSKSELKDFNNFKSSISADLKKMEIKQ
tara:strand:+ start:2021 stop:2344 length:324 start_codon:yes stop_codon:yes gene_type:complete